MRAEKDCSDQGLAKKPKRFSKLTVGTPEHKQLVGEKGLKPQPPATDTSDEHSMKRWKVAASRKVEDKSPSDPTFPREET
jgi:hypothetical protein